MGEPRKGGESPRLCYTISRLYKFQVAWNQERIKTGGGGGGRTCNCTTWLWSGWNGRLVPKYTFHSLTTRCSSGWLANRAC